MSVRPGLGAPLLLGLACAGFGGDAADAPGPLPTTCDAAHADYVHRLIERECAIEAASPDWPLPYRLESVVSAAVPPLPTLRTPLVSWGKRNTQVPWSEGIDGVRAYWSTPDNPRGPFWPDKIREAVVGIRGPVALAIGVSQPMSEVAEVLQILHDTGHPEVQLVVDATAPRAFPPPDPALHEAFERMVRREPPGDARVKLEQDA